jgi:hypothetical protein
LFLRSKKIAAVGVSLRRHLGPLPQILECFCRPREGTFFSDLAADPKVFLSFHPLHLLSSGYFEKLHAFCTLRTPFVTGIADFSVCIERSGHICTLTVKKLQLLV